jgi:23S rRNA pseudouridine1911/1915/1917 synthase
MVVKSYSTVSRARNFIKSGGVIIDGITHKLPASILKSGQKVEVLDQIPKSKSKLDFEKSLDVLWQDKHYVAVFKPVGAASVDAGSSSSISDKMKSIAKSQGIDFAPVCINRIEKKESGILLFAMGPKEAREMKELWPRMDKKFYAIVPSPFERDRLRLQHKLVMNRIELLKHSPSSPDAREAELNIRKLNANDEFTLLKIEADPGFRQQVRAQLAQAGLPVCGDKRYGSKVNPLHQICLHLFSLSFVHPITGENIELKTQVPRDFLRLTK